MPSARPAEPKKLYGRTQPRLWTPPLRPLNRRTSRGYEVIDFAEIIGEPLLPWQRWAIIHSLELKPGGGYRFRTVLILVARQNGKSQLKRIVSLWRMYMDGARRILGVAQDVALARDQMDMCKDTIHGCPDLEAEWKRDSRAAGNEWFEAAGCRYGIKAANRRAGRGGSNDEVNIDELREQQDWDAYGAVSKTTLAKANGQLWAMSNAGDDSSVVLNQLRDVALAGRDPTIGVFEWSAPDGCELDDVEAWRQANPGLGYIISEAAIRSACDQDPPAVFRTEVLCQRVDQLDGAIDLIAWKACADPGGTMDGLRDRVGACVDVSPDSKHVTLAVAALTPDSRPRVEIVKAWDSTEAARAELPALLDKVRPAALAWYPSGPAAALAVVLRPAALRYNHRRRSRESGELPEDGELTGGKVTEVCQGLADITLARQILHPGDPLLDAHIAAAKKLTSGDGWRFTRRGKEDIGHVDAAYAAAGAVYVAQTMPPVQRSRIRILG